MKRDLTHVSVNIDSLHNILKHPIRRKIVLILHDKEKLSYVDLMTATGITNTGKLNYHLKIMGDLLEKDDNGKYHLTDKGILALQILQKFPEKTTEPKQFRAGDTILIGFAGFLLVLANPGFWGFSLIRYIGVGVAFLGLIYALVIPGGIMWWLTVRRTNSHDFYDLFKPPFVSFVLTALLFVFMALLGISITISVQYDGSTGAQIAQPVLPTFVIAGVFFPFLGVGISEGIHKMLRRA
jgi:predicted transcriptional regulator